MIAQLTGKVVHLETGYLILDVNGVGLGVHVPADLALRIGDQIVLHTHLHVRESELTLYGFSEPDAKSLFQLLLGVSGVGPTAAIRVMSTVPPETLRRAILNGQQEVLARAPGVGRKTGEAIVLHLKDKLKRFGELEVHISEDDADVLSALTALGFSIVEAQRALQQLPRDGSLSLDEKIRQALTYLGR